MRRLGEDSGVPFTPLVFTGISSYSADFNTVLKRAVAIASLPLQKLQNDDADILSKKTLLGWPYRLGGFLRQQRRRARHSRVE